MAARGSGVAYDNTSGGFASDELRESEDNRDQDSDRNPNKLRAPEPHRLNALSASESCFRKLL
jgi:hypothetical protein